MEKVGVVKSFSAGKVSIYFETENLTIQDIPVRYPSAFFCKIYFAIPVNAQVNFIQTDDGDEYCTPQMCFDTDTAYPESNIPTGDDFQIVFADGVAKADGSKISYNSTTKKITIAPIGDICLGSGSDTAVNYQGLALLIADLVSKFNSHTHAYLPGPGAAIATTSPTPLILDATPCQSAKLKIPANGET